MKHEEHDKQTEREIRRIVKEFGWYVALFEATTATPAFAYTIGLWKNFRHPEIISFGLSLDTLGAILNNAGNLIKEGQKIEVEEDNQEIFNNSPARFKAVHPDNMSDYFGYGKWFNEYKDFPAIQLFWTDTAFNYPWDKLYDENLAFRQPLLYQKLDFKFFEPKNAAVFTLRQIIKEGMSILNVIHDAEGDWQFLHGDIVAQEDLVIVALEQMVKRDSTINELFDMPTGQVATRDYVGGKWTREIIEETEE
jgi:hypothetical protein